MSVANLITLTGLALASKIGLASRLQITVEQQ
jgi:hypothetical protein